MRYDDFEKLDICLAINFGWAPQKPTCPPRNMAWPLGDGHMAT